jgi:peptidoglycan/LPS O-acetylase OafA/YrhL
LQITPTEVSFRPDIQGLRAIAVGLVVLAHAGAPGFAGGYVGVDVFFVLSGYLITGLLVDERLKTGSIRYLAFLARRLRRLLPAMLTMLVLVLLLGSILLTAFEMRMQARSFPFAATWISNFFFAFAERDYFQALQDKDLFLHTWSLGVEEQFYLLWPWLVLVLVGLRTSAKDQSARGWNMVMAMGMIGVVSFSLCVLMTQMTSTLAFYMMPARIWQFALGAIVFAGLNLAAASHPRGDTSWALPTGLSGLILVFASAVLLNDAIAYPGWYALAPSLGATLIIAAGTVKQHNGVSALLGRRPLIWVGDRSYSIYLWHWPVLVLGDALGLTRSGIGVVGAVALSVLLAALSYRYVEYPFWKGRYRNVSALRVAVVAMFSVILSVSTFGVVKSQYLDGEVRVTSTQTYDPRQDADSRIYSASLTCDTFHFDASITPCAIGNRDGTRLAVLVGDSIGVQWSPLISRVFADRDWQILVLTKSACAIVDKSWYYERVGGDYEVCSEWRDRVLDYVAELKPDVLFIGSSSSYDFSREDWTDGTSRILERAAGAARDVVLVSGTPSLSFDGPSCLEDPWRFSFRLSGGTRECEEAQTKTQSDEVRAYLQEVASGFGSVSVLDLNDLVCPKRLCAASTSDGVVVYRDSSHLTASFVLSLVPSARERLMTMGINPSSPESDKP